ncbi:ATP-dependent helicase, putative [Plasmodium gallinaceum]|uniref:ATP-dependent RNA helicase n=1 Tax=Plasmodium gallinaceum TaxID=5849 RepID=A0A1J1GZ07_PLAGA|nr:ATP-dependent helicase, putative [Plasmodium gallinaceum]CRG97819.1 ATP-dependent helicase, putative [Plasmodium gallinaceum]
MFFIHILIFSFFCFFCFFFQIYSYNIININIKLNKYVNLKNKYKNFILKNSQRNFNYTVENFPSINEIINNKDDYFFKSNKTFSDLNVHKTLVEELKKNNINVASIIQSDLLDYYNKNYEKLKNIIIGAENGIGKTLSYIILILNHLLNQKKKNTCIIIFQYSNLLCNQCYDIIKLLSKNVKVKTINLKNEDKINLNKNHIIISTPVKFYHYMKENKEILINFFQNLKFLIIDEADVIFEKPYIKYMNYIFDEIKKIHDNFVSIITSSTLCNKGKKSIYNNIMKYIKNSVIIKTNYFHNIHPFINYHFINLPIYNINTKFEAIKKILQRENHKKVLIFCNTIKSCNQAFSLMKSVFDNIFIFNSSFKKTDQLIILEHFKNSQKPILVTTDIIYRGIDVKNITHLFHFDTPTNIIVYTHRNGRISRGASTGDIYIFNNLNDLITKKIYELHKNNVRFEELFSRKRSLRKNYKRELKNSM